MIDFSIIIPHRNSVDTLRRLLNSIPDKDNLEIVVVDNSDIPLSQEQINIAKEYKLLWAEPNRFAGGARNIGIEAASGKWLIFADADDYFTSDAFDAFEQYIESDVDIVYFNCEAIYPDTGENSDRADDYIKIISDYNVGLITKDYIRYNWPVPWAKMIKRTLVQDYKILFDEVVAANDAYFSLLSGFYAENIDICDKSVYVVTVVRGSLSKRRDYHVIKSRFCVILKCNNFLNCKNLSKYQHSVMYYYILSLKFGFNAFVEFSKLIIEYKQNPFIGLSRWGKSFFCVCKDEIKNHKYILR